MAAEFPRRREFTQLMADHILGNKHRNVDLAVVYGYGFADEIR